MRFLQSLISAIAGSVTPPLVPQSVVPLASVALPVPSPPPGVPLLSSEDRSSRSTDRNRSRSSSRFSPRGRARTHFSQWIGPAAGCRFVCQTLLIVLVCGLPWWFGGVQPWAQVVSFGVLAIASAFGLGGLILGTGFSESRHTEERFARPIPRLFWLLVLGGGLGLLQILPLPTGVLRVIAPHSAAYWEALTPRPTEPAAATAWGLATGD